MNSALWVLAHPHDDSLNALLAASGVRALQQNGWNVDVHDLYRDRWDPLLRDECAVDVRREQDRLRVADVLIMQFPLWWYGVPAIMKGWIDRVFEAGFAYDVVDASTGKPAKYNAHAGLAGKRALAVVTAGDRHPSLADRGISGHIEHVLWPLLHGTFWYTGMEALRPHLIAEARGLSDNQVANIRHDLTERVLGLLEEPAIPYFPLDERHYDHGITLLPYVNSERTGLDAHIERID